MKKTTLCMLVSACLLAVALTAQSQQQESDIEVLITASRVEEPAAEIPAHVSVITAGQLSSSGHSSLVSALESLAGLHFRSFSGNEAQAQVSMRGFGENSFGRVLVLVDGRRLNRPDMASINWLEIPLQTIERIEVVRGNSSVLYGDNAVAGVINIITKKGQAGFDVALSGRYGSYNQNQEGIELSGSGELLHFSIMGEHTATDGYRDRSAFRSLAFGGSAGLELDTLSSGLSLSYNRLFYELPGALDKTEFDFDPTQAQPGHGADESIGDYVNADLSFAFSPYERLLFDGNAGYRLRSIRTDLPSFPSFTDLNLQSLAFTPKLELELPLLNGNRLIIGVDGFLDRANLDSYPDIDRVDTTLETQITKTAIGVYATDDLEILPLLSASAGLRYELTQISAKTLKTSGAPIDESKLHQAMVYDLSVMFTPLSAVRIWGGYGTSFRFPFVDEQVSIYGFPFDTFYADLEPETGYTVELGLELEAARWLRWAASTYLLDMHDEIAVDPLTFANVNLDATRHLGAETEITLTVPKQLEISGNYTYTLATFREGSHEGKRVPLVPLHQASAAAALLLPLGGRVGVSGQYISDTFAAGDLDNNQAVVPAYLLVGAHLRFRPEFVPGDLELSFGVENLLDVRYASMGVYSEFQGKVFYYPGAGRRWSAGASCRY